MNKMLCNICFHWSLIVAEMLLVSCIDVGNQVSVLVYEE